MPKKTIKDKPDPILEEAAKVEIAGETYTIRRLGLRDVFRVARILGNGVAVLGDAGSYTPGQIIQVLVASMTRSEEEVLSLIADLLGVKRGDLDDTQRFPMDSIVDVFEALSRSQDLQAFLARLEGMMGSLPEMQQAAKTP